ncbi:hypothetical protein D3C76_1266650 [compost metagenome]
MVTGQLKGLVHRLDAAVAQDVLQHGAFFEAGGGGIRFAQVAHDVRRHPHLHLLLHVVIVQELRERAGEERYRLIWGRGRQVDV